MLNHVQSRSVLKAVVLIKVLGFQMTFYVNPVGFLSEPTPRVLLEGGNGGR